MTQSQPLMQKESEVASSAINQGIQEGLPETKESGCQRKMIHDRCWRCSSEPTVGTSAFPINNIYALTLFDIGADKSFIFS